MLKFNLIFNFLYLFIPFSAFYYFLIEIVSYFLCSLFPFPFPFFWHFGCLFPDFSLLSSRGSSVVVVVHKVSQGKK